ncbi:MAG: DUF763 domain-containing protein [Aeropyrum sp.]|nr:DUF763 domain-containing protein [Aeropyrum sp.]
MVGIAELPLHGGRVPRWMLRTMERLGLAIARAVVEVKGPRALVEGLSNPYWFQAFNNVIGMDWDSSGSTTVTLYVLRKASLSEDLGFMILGGKGSRMLEIEGEASVVGERFGVDPGDIRFFSKGSARISNTLLQDGYSTYIHALAVSEDGYMVAVEQGMNVDAGMSRRYHIVSTDLEDPFTGVSGVRSGVILNSLGRESREARRAYLDLLGEGARRLERLVREANAMIEGRPSLDSFLHEGRATPRRVSGRPYYRPLKLDKRTARYLEMLAEASPTSDRELLSAPGLTPKVVRALALVADVIFGVSTSTRDPVDTPLNPFVYAYAVGGKDGVPYRFDRRIAEMVTVTLEEAIELARIGRHDKLRALSRLRRLLDPLRGEKA